MWSRRSRRTFSCTGTCISLYLCITLYTISNPLCISFSVYRSVFLCISLYIITIPLYTVSKLSILILVSWRTFNTDDIEHFSFCWKRWNECYTWYTSAKVNQHICMYVHVCMYVCPCMSMYVYVCTCMCVYVYMCICTHVIMIIERSWWRPVPILRPHQWTYLCYQYMVPKRKEKD